VCTHTCTVLIDTCLQLWWMGLLNHSNSVSLRYLIGNEPCVLTFSHVFLNLSTLAGDMADKTWKVCEATHEGLIESCILCFQLFMQILFFRKYRWIKKGSLPLEGIAKRQIKSGRGNNEVISSCVSVRNWVGTVGLKVKEREWDVDYGRTKKSFGKLCK
jgi:hypothetical protein